MIAQQVKHTADQRRKSSIESRRVSRIDEPGNPQPESRVRERLVNCGYHVLHDLSCEVHDDVLVLSGQLPSYHMKQLAQTLVRDVPGINTVVNNTTVVRAQSHLE